MARVTVDMARAPELAAAYKAAGSTVEDAAVELAGLVREAEELLSDAGAARGTMPVLTWTIPGLFHTGGELGADGADLAWRVDFLRSVDGRPLLAGRFTAELPDRNPALRRARESRLLELVLGGGADERSAALVELAIRTSTDPELAERVLSELGGYRIWQMMDGAHRYAFSNGASFLKPRGAEDPIPVWDDVAIPLAVIFGNAVDGRRSRFADDLFRQAEAAVYDDVGHVGDIELAPGTAFQLMALLAATTELPSDYAIDAIRLLDQSNRNPYAGTDYVVGGFITQPLNNYDHFSIMVKVLADHPDLMRQLMAPPEVRARSRQIGFPGHVDRIGPARDQIDADELWLRVLSSHGDATHVAGAVVEAYLLDAPNGADDAWSRFEVEFAGGRTDRRSDPILDALALKWSENVPRSVALGNDNQLGQQALDDFLTAVFESDTAFATITVAMQMETRDHVARQISGEFHDAQQLGRLWEAYGIGLVESDRADNQTALSFIEAAAEFAWSSGVEHVAPKPLSLSVKALKAVGEWVISEGADRVGSNDGGDLPTPREAVLSFTRVDFHSSASFDWNVADLMLRDPAIQAAYAEGLTLLDGSLSADGGLSLPSADATDVERSDYAEWFDETFYAADSDLADPTNVLGDLDGDGRLSAAERSLAQLGREISVQAQLARGLLNDAADNSEVLD